ncbi:MAG: 8-amino-7-oxononanoate synthase [Gemmatimonadaceae bacterium]
MTTLPLAGRSSIDDALASDLTRLRDQHLERSLRRPVRRRGAVVETTDGATLVDFSSNDYLGLASDERLVAAATDALGRHGVGAGAARLISGNSTEHDALERELAVFFGAERALTFSSGYAANVGVIPALVGRDDAVFADALNHASLIDGCRLSRATVHVYPHADAGALAELLERHRPDARRALIVSDGLFSMDGDAAPLAALVDLAHRFGAWTYIDDAHAVGVIGADGRGSASDAGCAGAVDVTLGTLGKAFGAAGAFVYGSSTLVQYLVNRARSFVFSTAMLPAQAAAARAALRIVASEPDRRFALADNGRRLRGELSRLGIEVLSVEGPIVPVVIGDETRTMQIGESLARRGYLVGAVRPPTVPQGGSRLRITASAAHTREQIEGLARALADAIRG